MGGGCWEEGKGEGEVECVGVKFARDDGYVHIGPEPKLNQRRLEDR